MNISVLGCYYAFGVRTTQLVKTELEPGLIFGTGIYTFEEADLQLDSQFHLCVEQI
jgi:hypothetical protein